MKKLRSLWKDFLKKGFAILTIFMMLGQLGQGAITAFANELAVGDNGALDVTLMYGDKQDHPGECPIIQGIPCLVISRSPLRI